MHQFCSIIRNMPYLFHKYSCNPITEPHNVTNWAWTELHCSCCSVLTCSSNAMPTDQSVHWQFAHNFIPFCTAISNYKAAQYAISRQLKTRHQQFSSLNCVWFVSVRSRAANSSLEISSSVSVCSTVHKLYCRSEASKYSAACGTMFRNSSIKYINTALLVARCSGTVQSNT